MILLQFGFYGVVMGFGLSGLCWLLGLVYTAIYGAVFKHNN